VTVKNLHNIIIAHENEHLDKLSDLIDNDFTPALKNYFNIITSETNTDYVPIKDIEDYFLQRKITKEGTIINLAFIRAFDEKLRDVFVETTRIYLIKFLRKNSNNKLAISEILENIIYTKLILANFPNDVLNQIYFITSNMDVKDQENLNPGNLVQLIRSQMLLPYAVQLIKQPNNEKLPIEKTFQINANTVRGAKISVFHMLEHFDLLKYSHYTYGKPFWDNLKDIVIEFYKDSEKVDFLKKCFEKNIVSKHIDNIYGVHPDELFFTGNSYYNIRSSEKYCNTFKSVLLGTVLEDNLTVYDNKPFSFSVSNQTTEKLYYNIYFKNPFVVFNNAYYLKNLKLNYGYKSFSPFIDESYDDIEDDLERYYAGVLEIKRICEMSEEDKLVFLKNVKPICEHNFKVMSETIKNKEYFK
jgi:hypothetical protein